MRDRASQPSLRSDGKQIAFRDWNSGNRGVVVMDTYGGNARRVTNYSEDGMPAYSPDGQQLFFHSAHEPDRQERIYQANISGRTDPALNPGGAPVFGLAPIWLSNRLPGLQVDLPQRRD